MTYFIVELLANATTLQLTRFARPTYCKFISERHFCCAK